MNESQPATLKEALRIIARQQAEIQNKKIEILNQKNEIRNQKVEIATQKIEIDDKIKEIRALKEKPSLQLAWRFAKHSEKYFSSQPTLFDEDEFASLIPEEDETKVHDGETFNTEIVKSYKRNKKGRKPLPAELPRVVEVLDIPQEEKACG